jgi:hypothetical protein
MPGVAVLCGTWG